MKCSVYCGYTSKNPSQKESHTIGTSSSKWCEHSWVRKMENFISRPTTNWTSDPSLVRQANVKTKEKAKVKAKVVKSSEIAFIGSRKASVNGENRVA